MRSLSLYDKLLEIYSTKNNPEKADLLRCVEVFLHKKYDSKKIEAIVEGMIKKYDFEMLAQKRRNRNLLASSLDSIILNKVRESYTSDKEINIETLSEMHLKALAKIVLINLGYELLYIPPINSGTVDFVVYRRLYKRAVFVLNSANAFEISKKQIENARRLSTHLNCEQLMVFTNTDFSQEAYKYAEHYQIYLINGSKFTILVRDLVESNQEKEKKLQVKENELLEDDKLFLEADIKNVKTKVRVMDVTFIPDYEKNELVFEGVLLNAGKHPVTRLMVNIRLYGRDRSFRDLSCELGDLANGNEAEFKIQFDISTEYEWKNIYKYMIKLSYRNI